MGVVGVEDAGGGIGIMGEKCQVFLFAGRVCRAAYVRPRMSVKPSSSRASCTKKYMQSSACAYLRG